VNAQPTLQRRIGVGLLTAYGVGVMVGAGIYVLVGVVAGHAGVWAPLAFLIAGLVAAPSALSYAELSTRLPEAAGEVAYVEAGLRSHALAVIVGLGIVVAGSVSAAAVLRGGMGYLTGLFDVPEAAVILVMGLALTGIALVGVLESLTFAAVLTAVEVVGLVLVVWAGMQAEPSADWAAPAAPLWAGLGLAASLAFYAFLGFEDIVNMAEEVRQPEATLPRAILWSLAITAVLYALVSWAAVRAVPLGDLTSSEAPLAEVWRRGFGGGGALLVAIAVAAALNGVLAQIVMAARVLFGLGRREPALAVFHKVHPRLGTPVRATLVIGAFVIAAALALPVATLAETTSLVLLGVFVLINLALLRLKRRVPEAPFCVPMAVPAVGAVLSAAAFGLSLWGFA